MNEVEAARRRNRPALVPAHDADGPPGERLIYRRPAGLSGVEELIVHQSPRLWRVFHEAYSVSTGSSGATSIAYRRVLHRFEGTGFMVTEPGEIHENKWIASTLSFSVAFLAPSLVESAAREMGRPLATHFRVGVTTAPFVQRAFRAFHASSARGDDRLECQSYLANGVRCLLSAYAEQPPPEPARVSDRALARVRDVLHARLRENVGLEELATEAGISQYHLVRAFGRRYGVPPHAYRLLLRTATARPLLIEGLSPAHVAAELGFSDQSHLTRVFRRIYGVTPGDYARLKRGT